MDQSYVRYVNFYRDCNNKYHPRDCREIIDRNAFPQPQIYHAMLNELCPECGEKSEKEESEISSCARGHRWFIDIRDGRKWIIDKKSS